MIFLGNTATCHQGGPGSRDHSSDHCLATQHYPAFRTQQCELYIDVDCRDLRDLYESQWQQHLEHQLRQQHHQLRQQLHQQYQHRVKQHQHRHQQQHQLGEEQQVQSSEPRNVSISATLAGTFLARVNPATSTARQIRCSTILSGRILTLELVPQIDPSVPQPVVQSQRRPLLGPSPG